MRHWFDQSALSPPTATSRMLSTSELLNLAWDLPAGASVVALSLACVLFSLLGGCAGQPAPPAAQLGVVPLQGAFAASESADQATICRVADGWIDSLQDDRLSALVREAVGNNWNLRGAQERLVQARLLAARSGAALWPQVDGIAGANWADVGKNSSSSRGLRLGVAATWELDVWGRVRAAQRAADADELVAAADLLALRRSVAAQAAQSWVLLTVAEQQLALDEELLATRERTLRITESRLRAGVALPIDSRVAKADVTDARALVLFSRQAADDARRSLEVLLGRYPAAEIGVAMDLPSPPAQIPVGLPSELLERRPDLIAADQRVAAAFYRIQEAKAARLPRFALTGELGMASDRLRDVLNPSNVAWSLGGNLVAPLVDGGQRRIDVEIAESRQREALAAYVSTAIAAFAEVEQALSLEASLMRQSAQLEASVVELRKSREAAELRYRQGLLSIFELTQIEARLFGASRELVAARGARIVQRIALHLALGGNFASSPAESPPEASPEQ